MNKLCLALCCLLISLRGYADDYFVVLGSFTSKTSAQELQQHLKETYKDSNLRSVEQDNQNLFRVVIGPYNTNQAAQTERYNSEQLGIANAWVYRDSKTDDSNNFLSGSVASDRVASAPTKSHTTDSRSIISSTASSMNTLSTSTTLDKATSSRVSLQSDIQVTEFLLNPPPPILREEIRTILSSRVGRSLPASELLSTTQKINQLIAAKGYINSGITIPDQKINDGQLALNFVAGNISSIDIQSSLRNRFITSRLDISSPFNLLDLQQSLKALEREQQVTRIDAKIEPGINAGEASLSLAVETPPKMTFGITTANNRSPSIGSINGDINLQLLNLTGWGERYSLSSSITQGLDAHSASVNLPIASNGTNVEVRFSASNSSVIEEPFDDIDVDSKTESLSWVLNVPVYQTLDRTINAHITLEARRNETELLGQAFSFSEGAINGESKVAPVRVALSYLEQSNDSSIAARVSISRGTSKLNATLSDNQTSDQADGRFTSYLVQTQYSRRLTDHIHFTVRALAQHASDPLLSIEKFALGGVNSVRGYRENQVVRDSAYLASAELVYQINEMRHLNLIAFTDWGRGENHKDALTTGKTDLSSVGVGFTLTNWHGISAALYVAHALDDFNSTQYDLQDDGIHFRLGYQHAF